MKNHFGIGLLTKITTEKITETAQRLFAAFFIITLALQPTVMVYAETQAMETESMPAVSNNTVPVDSIDGVSGLQESNLSIPTTDDTVLVSDQKQKDDKSRKEPKKDASEDVTTPENQMNAMGTPTGEGMFVDQSRELREKKSLAKTDANTGALSFIFPIEVPPGRSHIQPDLQLQYNNQNVQQDSVFGYGWSINIPYIERINKTGTNNLYIENNFNSSLSGELVYATGTVYTPKSDDMSLTYSFNGTTWIVIDKKGTTYTFGLTAQSLQNDLANTSRVMKWMLEEVRDSNNNYISYTYFKDQGQIYPDTITYTGNGTTSGNFQVQFLRENRSDVSNSYATAFSVTTAYRINSIKILDGSVLRNQFALNYTTGDNAVRSLLSSVTQTGYDQSANGLSKTTNFSYTKNIQATVPTNPDGTVAVNWTIGGQFPFIQTQRCTFNSVDAGPMNSTDCGVRVADLNGDGYQDYISAYSGSIDRGWGPPSYFENKKVYINNGGNGFTEVPWQIPYVFSGTNPIDSPTTRPTPLQLVDVNGDARADLIWQDGSPDPSDSIYSSKPWLIYINTGTGWAYDANYASPHTDLKEKDIFLNIQSPEQKLNFTDINNDGYIDIVMLTDNRNSYGNYICRVYLNNHTNGWADVSATWTLNTSGANLTWPPVFNGDFTHFVDINNDKLPDIIVTVRDTKTYYLSTSYPTRPGQFIHIFKNTGSGWVYDPTLKTPTDVNTSSVAPYPTPDPYRITWHEMLSGQQSSSFRSLQVLDMNSDGLSDLLAGGPNAYISDGSKWVYNSFYSSALHQYMATPSSKGTIPSRIPFGDSYYNGLIPIEYNGDDSIDLTRGSDIMYVPDPNVPDPGMGGTFINQNKPADLLSSITYPEGGTTTVSYKPSTQYKNQSGNLLNPNVPFVIQTVSSMVQNDGNGNVATTSYLYADGYYYFNTSDLNNKKFAGFGKVTETDSVGNVVKTYYHQGNTTDSANGEYDDHISKAGKAYRIEQQGGSGNVYKTTINKWDRTDLGSGRNFVKLAQTASLDFDGNATHKDSAQTFSYDTATGNLTATTNWGEVNANSGTGSFSDIGGDAVSTTISYAANSSANIYLPSQETTQDQSANKVKETRHYYDGLALGSVSKGNETKTEYWKSGSSYVSTTKTYNSYGLVTQEKDARGNATNYTYDTYNLYPATVSNPLSQTKSFVYNYACGKPTSVTNENGRVFTVTYDGLCRPTEEKQPDLTTPTTLVTKATYVYTDTIGNRNVKKTTYLSSGNSVDEYTYLDGFDRVIQKRKEAEASNTFSVSDIVYDTRGLLQKESLPYFSSGLARTSPTATASLYSTNTYDPLKRAIVIATAVGNTTNTYDDWKVTTTDANGNVKDFVNDAFGNLVRVVEHNGASEYTTAYEYDRLGNLTKITDALGNVRNFTYDGLGRRLTAQDVHAPADGTFGTYTYTYDNAGNMTSRVDPKGQTVTWSYDTLNRPQNENYTGASGTEISYTYDSGTDGKTRLTRAVALGFATTTYAYNPLGQIKSETKTITGTSTSFATNYTYDRAGNQTLITYPDSAQAKYIFNTAGLLEKVQKKEQGEEPFSNVVTNYDYAPTGQPTTIAYANGVVTTNTYDPTALYRTTNKVAILPNGERAQDLAYTYDAIGNITRVVDNSNTLTKKTSNYTYDNLSRLLSATITNASSTNETQTFSYDALGNILAGPLGTYAYAGTGYANPHAMTSITAAASSSSHADIVFDATSNQSGHDVDTLQWSHTTGAEDDRLLVVTTYNDLDTTSVGWITYDDINLSFAQRIDNSGTQMEQWYLINPPEGAHDIVVSYNDIVHAGAIAETYSGVHQSEGPETAISATGIVGADGDNQPSQSIGVTTDKSLVIDGVYELGDTADLIPATEQTERSALTVEGSRMETSGKIQTYAGTTTVSWSGVPDNTPWGVIASVFAPAHIAVSPVSSHFTYDNNGNITNNDNTTYTWDYQNRLTQSGGIATSTYAYDHTGARVKLVEGSTITYFPNTLYNVTGTNTTKHIFANGAVVATVEKTTGSQGGTSTPTYVQSAINNDGSVTLPNPVTSGNIIVVGLTAYTFATIPSNTITDTLGNTYTKVNEANNNNDRAAIFYAKNVTGGFDFSIDSSIGGTISAHEYSGVDTVSPLDKTNKKTGTSKTVSSGNVTTTLANEFYFGVAWSMQHDDTWTAGSGYTKREQELENETVERHVTEDKVGNAQTTAATFTTGTSAAYSAAIATFKPGTTSGSSATTTLRFVTTDQLNGVNIVTDPSGNIVETLDYYPYGTIRTDTKVGSYVGEKRKFIGQEFDIQTQLSYLNARYYNGNTAKFLSQDPVFWEVGQSKEGKLALANPQAQNSYAYANNNPVTLSDPNGRFVPIVALGLAALSFYGGYTAGTDLYEGYTSGNTSQFGWGAVSAGLGVVPGGAGAKGTVSLGDDAVKMGLQAARSDAVQGVYKPLAEYVGERGYSSYRAFKNAMGTAKETIGKGFEWHHIIEQKNATQFGQSVVQNTKNIVGVPVQVHRQISALYSTKSQAFGNQVMRQGVSQLSALQQLRVGLETLSTLLSKLK